MMRKIRTQETSYAETVESEIDTFIMQNTDVSLLFYKLSERHFPVWMPPVWLRVWLLLIQVENWEKNKKE